MSFSNKLGWCPKCNYRGQSKLRLSGKLYVIMPLLILVFIFLSLMVPSFLLLLGASIIGLFFVRVHTCPTCGFEDFILDKVTHSTENEEKYEEETSYQSGKYKERPQSHNDIDLAFETLSILRNASKAEIKTAYRKRISEYHPDKVAGLGEKLKNLATEEAKSINAAYKLLKNAGYA